MCQLQAQLRGQSPDPDAPSRGLFFVEAFYATQGMAIVGRSVWLGAGLSWAPSTNSSLAKFETQSYRQVQQRQPRGVWRDRVNPDVARQSGRTRVLKLEPKELEKARASARILHSTSKWSSAARAEKRLTALDAERVAELDSLSIFESAATRGPVPAVGLGVRDVCVESQTRRGGRRTRRCDPHSVEQAASHHVVGASVFFGFGTFPCRRHGFMES